MGVKVQRPYYLHMFHSHLHINGCTDFYYDNLDNGTLEVIIEWWSAMYSTGFRRLDGCLLGGNDASHMMIWEE